MPAERESDDALEAELRGFTPRGPLDGLRERVLGHEAPSPQEPTALDRELGGFACEQPSPALRARIESTLEALETRSASRRAILAYLAALVAVLVTSAALNGWIAGFTGDSLRARPAAPRAERSPFRLPVATQSARQRTLTHLHPTTPRKSGP